MFGCLCFAADLTENGIAQKYNVSTINQDVARSLQKYSTGGDIEIYKSSKLAFFIEMSRD